MVQSPMCYSVENIIIRDFATSDAEAVSALVGTTLRRSNGCDYPLAILGPLIAYFTPEKLIQLAAERRCLVAETAGRVVATAALDGSHLATFFVDVDHQGRGIGTRLLVALEDVAQRIVLPAVYVNASTTGVSFYESRGYVRTGENMNGTAGLQIELVKLLRMPAA